MGYRYDTYCGLYCGACAVLVANRNGTLEEKAKAWSEKPEQLHCQGCKSDVNAVYCLDCGIKACAEGRKLEFCHQCDEFPCSRLVDFRNDQWAHHSVVLANLDVIRERGIDAWLDEQEARWNCPECAAPFTWYDETCAHCGNRLYNCIDEDKDLR